MADTTNLELVSPEKLLFSESVAMVVIPGTDGDMGVMPGHAPVISNIRPGTICVFENGSVAKRIFVAGGFAEVTETRCTVLAEQAVDLAEIDRASVEQEISNAKDDINLARDDSAKRAAEQALSVAEAKLEAVTAPVYA